MITVGGLRMLERFRGESRRAESMTDKPFGVDLTLMGCPRGKGDVNKKLFEQNCNRWLTEGDH